MNVEVAKAEIVVTNTPNGTVMNSEGGKSVSIMGDGPIFATKGSAAYVASSGKGQTADAKGNTDTAGGESQPKKVEPVMERDNTPKDDVTEGKTGNSGNTGDTKAPPKLTPLHGLVVAEVVKILKKDHNLEPIGEKIGRNPFLCRAQRLSKTPLDSLKWFDTAGKSLTDDSGMFDGQSIPLHILAMPVLLMDKIDVDGCKNQVMSIKKHITEICQEPDMAKRVATHVFTEHAKSFTKTYIILLLTGVNSKSNDRKKSIDKWVLELKKSASAYYKHLLHKVMVEEMQEGMRLMMETNATMDTSDEDVA